MQTNEEYNGWTNRETWACNLWLGNDESSYHHINDLAEQAAKQAESEQYLEQRHILAQMIQELVTELSHDVNVGESTPEARVMISDIGSIWRVDWQEIADNWLEQCAS
jgi:hypothetical protein